MDISGRQEKYVKTSGVGLFDDKMNSFFRQRMKYSQLSARLNLINLIPVDWNFFNN